MVKGMKIQAKEEVMVRPPATGSPPRGTTLWLSNLDMMYRLESYVNCTFFFRSDTFFVSSLLKATLSRALVEFYPLAGRLKRVDHQNGFEIECNGEGVLYIEATANGALLDLGADLGPRPDLTFAPVVDYSKGASALPLFVVQVTRFTCGGVCLGFALSHYVCDGFSLLQFLRTWADIARGAGITAPPFHDRQAVLSARHPPQPEFDHIEYHPPPTLIHPITSTTNNNTSYKKFRLTPDQVKALKESSLLSSTNIGNYTTYEVLAGHVWRCVSMARRLPKNQPTKLHMAVDGRERLLPRLPRGYFGNVVFSATPIALAGDLQENPVGFSVLKVHEALVRMDDRYLRSAIDYLEAVRQGGPAISKYLFDYRSPNLGIISWARLPMYEDFGLGKPVYAGWGSIPAEGISHVLPTHDGTLLYAIALPEQEMAIFEKLFYEL
ncbi:rosmarinate synthase-like [Andrographis paniculata]|uniref:rosmarinate synthase-like n=1 Tax=Andrographis paniculata TaxID=175694 RepID=UPI0021E9185F|nr:rosmarinate synthase-like [Andrographis paniculata]